MKSESRNLMNTISTVSLSESENKWGKGGRESKVEAASVEGQLSEREKWKKEPVEHHLHVGTSESEFEKWK